MSRVRVIIDYVMNPEKTTENVREIKAALHAVDGAAHRTTDGIEPENRCYVTGINCRTGTAAEQFRETKDFWSRCTGMDKSSGVQYYHGFQSFAEGEVKAETAHEIGVKLVERLWGDRFEAIVATHCNTNHYHNHFVMNSVSWKNGKKIRGRERSSIRFGDESNRLCREYGLSTIENPSGRKRSYAAAMDEKRGKPSYHSLIRGDIDRAAGASMTEREFYHELEAMGYELSLTSENGRPLTYPALKPPGADYFVGFHRLGREYVLDAILERISVNYRRELPFPEEERNELRRYRERTEPLMRPKGLRALYIRYCYELRILEKYPASVKRVPFFLREDLIHLEKLDEQARFLAEYGIDSIGDLKAWRQDTEERLDRLTGQRGELRKGLNRREIRRDTTKLHELRERIARSTQEIREVRKLLRISGDIEERSEKAREGIRLVSEGQQKTEEKEGKANERAYGRSGRTDRKDEPGRD